MNDQPTVPTGAGSVGERHELTSNITIPVELIIRVGMRDAFTLAGLYFGVLEIGTNQIRRLCDKGLLVRIRHTRQQIAHIIQAKDFSGHGIGQRRCEWCSIKTTALHRHHYPLRQSEGGIDIVNICPNCHQEFHSLENHWNFSTEVVELFLEVVK